MKTLLPLALTLAALGCVSCCHCLPTGVMTEDFDQTASGSLPSGWQAGVTGLGVPHWAVVADPTAPTPPNVLEQSGRAVSHGYPWCVNTNVILRDGFVEAAFEPISGQEDQAGGVVWRWRNADNYYIARGNALETNVILFRMVGGQRSEVRRVPFPIPAHQWHTLRVDFHGNRILIHCDGRPVMDCTDDALPQAGHVGLWTKADSVAQFDHFQCGR